MSNDEEKMTSDIKKQQIDRTIRIPKSSLLFVNVVNFELTYKCSQDCVHCIQKNIRKEAVKELSTEEVKTAILDSYKSGLCSLGVNFTGGEVLGNRIDIFEILDYTRSLGIKYRLNTNSWWANKKNFNVGNQYYLSANQLVEDIKHLGIEMFAFSCDFRLFSRTNQQNLISSVKLCEENGVKYQLIFSGLGYDKINGIIFLLKKSCGNLRYMIPVSMEIVDMGGAASIDKATLCHQSNKAYCAKKGFYRPTALHISPDGNVRTCMYALGLSDCGNLRQMSMINIVQNFQHRANCDLFSDPIKFQKAENEMLLPYQHYYNYTIHECTRFAIIARAAEMKEKNPQMGLNEIHTLIAQYI